MDFLMLRTIDQQGYYETRLILMALSLAIALFFFYYKRDRRYLLMFVSGAFFTMLMEYLLQFNGLRGAGYGFSMFGIAMPRTIGPVVQGMVEGGACSLFAFWFADLRSTHERQRQWLLFFILCVIVTALAFIAGSATRRQSVSSVRPLFATVLIVIVISVILVSLAIAWRKNALAELANFYGGLMLFAFLNLGPLHLTGSRYIGVYSGVQIVPVSTPIQIVITLLSYVAEFAGGRLHYFMIPFALGWVVLRGRRETRRRERYSTQHLQDLAQRGWRKKSKPFQRD
jgi:hypothetical protein